MDLRTHWSVHVCAAAGLVYVLAQSVWKHDGHFVKDKKQRSREKEDGRCSERLAEVWFTRYEGGEGGSLLRKVLNNINFELSSFI